MASREPLAIMAELIFPVHANHYATMFGGAVLSLMDKAAYVAASRARRRTMVTAALDDFRFLKPIPVGAVAEVLAYEGGSEGRKTDIDVELYAEDLRSGQRTLAATGRFRCIEVEAHVGEAAQ